VVVNLAHPVTDTSIWNTAHTGFQENLKRALSPEQYAERVKDCSAVLTHCLNDLALKAYIDPERIGIAGHSYGALTVQAITGQLLGGQNLRDPRIRAAIAFSPGAVSADRAKLMSKVNIPFFSITGAHDQFVTFKDGKSTMRLGLALNNRLMIYEQLPAGHKQLWILANADHMTFAGEPIDPQRYSRDVKVDSNEELGQWLRISKVSTTFWQNYLSDSKSLNQEDQTAFKNQLIHYQNTGDVLKFG
jgi:predicted dienelactone hydrolase